MKKLIYSLILILCTAAASASAEAAIKAKVDSVNDKIVVSGTAEPGADVPLMLLKPLNGATLSASNIGTYAIHITSATADGNGAFSKELPMQASYESMWYTLVSEGGSTSTAENGLKVYYPSDDELVAPLAAVNAAEDGDDMETALKAEASVGVKNADVLGASINLPEFTDYTSAFCQTLVGKKPWLSVSAFQSDFNDTVLVYSRYIEALAAINGANLETISGVISNYNDILLLTLTGKYATYQSAINKIIVGTYGSLDDFKAAFNYTVTNYQPPQAGIDGGRPGPSSPGVSSPGGSGGFAGGGLVVEKTDNPLTKVFSDLDSVGWAEESIVRLASASVVSGTGNNMFTPNGLVTREQFVKMILLALDLPADGENAAFTDVSKQDWYYSYVISATELGIVTGKDNGSFGAGEYVTREDMVTIAARAVKAANAILPSATTVSYTDEADISVYAKEAANAFGNAGIITGMPDGSFMPKDFSTRAQAAVMLDRLMQKARG